jgi:uncharacterized ferredoxin-like protein
MNMSFDDMKNKAIETVVALMGASAKTAPKSKGKDDLEIKFFSGEELTKAIDLMASEQYVESTVKKKEFFLDSDIEALKNCDGVLAVGIKAKRAMRLNCGKCGYTDCVGFAKAVSQGIDANCVFKMLDLGFACCSACKVASDMNIDNRVMYDIGEAIRRLYMKECDFVLGIALSIKGNNIFFDRYLGFFVAKAREENKTVDELMDEYGIKTK